MFTARCGTMQRTNVAHQQFYKLFSQSVQTNSMQAVIQTLSWYFFFYRRQKNIFRKISNPIFGWFGEISVYIWVSRKNALLSVYERIHRFLSNDCISLIYIHGRNAIVFKMFVILHVHKYC
jgi:hypothetical protein